MRSLICALLLVQSAAFAQTYPTKPVRLIVPYPPGGGNDTLARIFGQKLTEALGQQIIVENRAGAGTTIGTAFVARAVPDGYTLLLSSIATHAFAPHLYAKPGYDALRDFAPVTNLVIAPTVLAVNPALPVNTLKELVALAKKRPGQLEFASAGTGSSAHMLGETFKALAKIDIVQRLNKELVRIVNLPEIKEKLKDLGSDGVGNSPEEFQRFVVSEHASYGKLIKTMGIKPE